VDGDPSPVIAIFFYSFSAQVVQLSRRHKSFVGQGSLLPFNAAVEPQHILAASESAVTAIHLRTISRTRSPNMRDESATFDRSHNTIRTEIVTSYEQLLHAYAIRAICFMEEHGVKAQQTFDGNDYQATHVVVYAGEEPIGTIRIRWFKDFAKLERMSVRKAYRNPHVLKSFTSFMFDHIARKGYTKAITHAQPKYARLWRISFGFRNADGKKPVYFEGHEEPYLELVKELTPPTNAITENTDSTVLFRVEGFWDAPSEFESSTV
jgi:hypothetical protein